MKKILLFSLIIGALTFSSCNNDDEPVVENPILGTWHLIEIEITNTANEFQSYRGIALSPVYFDLLSEILFINEDNTFLVKRSDLRSSSVLTLEGTYTFENDELTLNFDNENIDPEVYLFSESGTLELEIEDVTMVFPKVQDPQTQDDYNIFPATTAWMYRKY